MTRALLACLAALLLSCAPRATAASDAAAPGPEARFADANAAFEAGARRAAEKPASAREAMQPAIEAYAALIDADGAHSAAMHYNLANAYLLSGDAGRAVLHYRRAERLDPSLPGLARNLAAARAKAGVPANARDLAAADRLFTWHTLIPQPLRLWLAAAGLGLAGAFTLLRALPRLSQAFRKAPRPPAWTALAAAGVSVLAILSLAAQEHREENHPRAVITAERVIGRKGPDDVGYQPSFTEPLRAGVDVTIQETRGPWVNVRLPDGRSTWLPASSVERV